jgi:NAD(P)-dependent dehydrogenase (short-subunit alcohol dehydrogenase family)
MDLEGKTILVTGAARRIGKALSLGIAKAGGDLLLHYNKSPDKAIALRDEIQKMGRKAEIVQADFSDPSASISSLDQYFSSGSIYGLINNASVFTDISWIDTSLSDWNQHFDINLTMPFLLCQSFGKSLPKSRNGRIINMLDWRALRPGADHFPYTISKAGLAALTKSMAAALAPRITVNGIALGAILPPSDGADINDVLSELPIPRWADVSEVVDTLLFLLAGPGYITGEIIHLDGGKHIS